ncbi:hypothetical protein [Azospirillum doebereinerae]|uniref:YncE family protein n=1 Tax=Azospirillum doebereinerae TaxID=92933 RepID=A0A3S0X1S9_9PROT|nr:hypothetical protein [Azospirillum doebereinerae]RUQ75217.1 hypothetical protein EJ913_05050 [Azospirillum doebereinerae]
MAASVPGLAVGTIHYKQSPAVHTMLKNISYVYKNAHGESYRTEDVKFSPSGRRMAVISVDNCIFIYDVNITARPIQVILKIEIRSASLIYPHGVDFLSEDVIVVANRGSDIQFYEIPFVTEGVLSSFVDPIYQAPSPWFGKKGIMKQLPERKIYTGPGGVRFLNGILFVSCNNIPSITTHVCTLTPDGMQLQDDAIITQDGFQVLDGVAVSQDGSRLAVSDLSHNRIVLYDRLGSGAGHTSPQSSFTQTVTLQDEDLRFPHGLCFDPSGKILYVTDAGSPNVYVFATQDDWASSFLTSSFKLKAVRDAAFAKTRTGLGEPFRSLEGGAKGIDIDPTGTVVVVTCKNQPLRFFETQPGMFSGS